MSSHHLYFEVVRDERSIWSRATRIGRVWKNRPDEHRGRLIRATVELPPDFLNVDETTVTVVVPADEPDTVAGSGEVLS